jgi:hypothetical protein
VRRNGQTDDLGENWYVLNDTIACLLHTLIELLRQACGLRAITQRYVTCCATP